MDGQKQSLADIRLLASDPSVYEPSDVRIVPQKLLYLLCKFLPHKSEIYLLLHAGQLCTCGHFGLISA